MSGYPIPATESKSLISDSSDEIPLDFSKPGTLEQFNRRIERLNDAWVRANLAAAGDRGCLRLVNECDLEPKRSMIIAPNASKAGVWNVTEFDQYGPWGHQEFKSREIAIRAASGESFSKLVAGPHYYSARMWRVCEVRGNHK